MHLQSFVRGIIVGIIMFIGCFAVTLEITGVRFQPVYIGQSK